MTMNGIFMVAIIPLVVFGSTFIGVATFRVVSNFFIAALCLMSLVLIRSKVPLSLIPVFPVTAFGAWSLFLLSTGQYGLWAGVWLFAFPPIAFFLCRMVVGLVQSMVVLAVVVLFMFTPFGQISPEVGISIRFLFAYSLILSVTIIYERISILKERMETQLRGELSHERDVIRTMKDNVHQGVFLMDAEFRIQPQYSRPLISILSYYDSELEGKNFLDIISGSLTAKQLQIIRGYFVMVFGKEKSAKVLEAANPISQFEYRVDDRIKYLRTSFHLVEQPNDESVIIGILQDVTREAEFEKELQAQKGAQELEMKNMFDVLQIEPTVFQDFVEDTESNFNYINATLKDKSLTENQVVTKFFQNIHAIKSNAFILGLESFGKKLHALEDDVKAVLAFETITVQYVLGLAVKLELIMQDKDNYTTIVKRIEAYKTSNQIDSILVNSLSRAVEKLSQETQKKVVIKAGQVDRGILETKLRKPIKDILFQCVRNSIYHGIEPVDERVRKNKTPQGLLVFTLKKVDDMAELAFSDDGRGLDWEKIRRKYLDLHPEAKTTSRQTLLAAVFSTGFSSADTITTSAGRGVGLSLVKTLVKENHGHINVTSSESGLNFKFTFPLSTEH